MSESLLDLSSAGKKRKTRYSRKGCLQCKKSHLKCDEGQPKCGKCTKRGIDCTYQLSLVFQDVSESKIKTLPVIHSIMAPSKEESSSFSASAEKAKQKASRKTKDRDLSVGNAPDMRDFNLRNFIYVSPSDANLLNMPFIVDEKHSNVENNLRIPLNSFELNWRSFIWIDMLQLLEREDPFQLSYHGNSPASVSEITFDDPALTHFIWRFASTTLIAGNFLMFPNDRFEKFMQCLWTLNQHYPIVQDAIRYDISVFMEDVYVKANLKHFSCIWDRYVRMPSFKQVLGTINERIQNSQDFVEYVCLTFTVFLLFFANSALRSNLWRTHLRGCQQLLIKASILMPKEPKTELERGAIDIFRILKDWFCHAETTALLASNYGISLIDTKGYTKSMFLQESSPVSVIGNAFDLIKGMSVNLNSVYYRLLLKILEIKEAGLDLTGLNIVLYKLNRHNVPIPPDLLHVGREMLTELQHSAVLDAGLDLHLAEVADLRLRFSMQASHYMFYLLMELYLKVFYLDMDPKSEEIRSLLYKMIKTAYSSPYYSSCGVCCHPSLFLGGLISILADDEILYFHFIDILNKIADTGMAVAKNSVDKLNEIKSKLFAGDFEHLINPDHDFIPI